METTKQNIEDTDIAIIGMAGKFPGADNLSQFWENLKQGVISIKHFSDEELIENEVNKQDLQHPNYVRAKGTLDDIEYFDGEFFDYSGREAEILDPQIRLLTELSWQALEDAGYIPEKYDGSIGVYTGVTNNLYWQLKMIASGKITNNETLAVSIYSEKDHASSRVSYKLNLTGPSFTVETQCSTSLVAFHLACQGVINGECDMAVAGGATINLPNKAGYIFQEGSIHSKDGICRAFDENANGTVFSDGAGIVVVKNAKKAIADRDNIYALVKGSAINNDGLEKAGFTAPSIRGQKDVISRAYKKAGVSPETITYIETHGTGTALGDPIEIEALTQAFATNKRGYCRIGSLKPNVGHMDNAAGIGNVIKATLAIKNKQIPPSVNFNKPNPKIKFDETPFVVNTELTDWEENQNYPRRAGVSSYGVGGTNAHALLEEYIPQSHSAVDDACLQLIPFSAKSEYSFNTLKENLQSFVETHPVCLHEVAFTLQRGRSDFNYRSFVLTDSSDELVEKLKNISVPSSTKDGEDFSNIFLFPGQGAQYINMGKGLYQQCKPFQVALDRCFTVFQQIANEDLHNVVFSDSPEAKVSINETKYVQPIIFSFEFALATVLIEAGVKPDCMIGHSIGEYTAACISGVFSLQDAMRLVIKRGELMQSLPRGSMMALMMEPEELKYILPEDVSIAAINSTRMTVVSGRDEAIDLLESKLKKQGVEGRRLFTSHAFHSQMMNPIINEFERFFKEVEVNEPQIKYISNLSGKEVQTHEIKKPSYWSAHLRNTVLFKEGIRNIPNKENAIFIEVGPGNTLGTFLKRFSPEFRNYAIYNTVRHPQEKISDTEVFYNVIGKIWQKGVAVNWTGIFGNSTGKRASLPVYPFDRKKHWVKGDVYQMTQGSGDGPVTYKPTEMLYNRWIYKPTWTEARLNTETLDTNGKAWIVLSDSSSLSKLFLERTKEIDSCTTVIKNGNKYQHQENGYVVNPESKTDYKKVFEQLKTEIKDKEINILHFWSLNGNGCLEIHSDKVKESQAKGLISILFLVQSISAVFPKNRVNIKILSNNIHNVGYKDILNPLNATLLGAITTIPLEYKNISMCGLDLDLQHLTDPALAYDMLKAFIINDIKDNILALRKDKLFTRTFENVRFKYELELQNIVKDNGVYLVTGGLGGIGVELATYLSKTANVKLALTGRTEFPDRSKWDKLVKSGGNTADRIRRILEIEKNGTEVMVVKADVADKNSMKACIDKVQAIFGSIKGVLHCAGIAGGNIVPTLEPDLLYDTMNSKVFGTLILDELLAQNNLDFTILCSSISSVTGTFGQMSYTAANSFMDAYTHYKNTQGKSNVICFNWDIWQEVGMATKAIKQLNREDDIKIHTEDLLEHPLFVGHANIDQNKVYVSHLSPKLHWMMNEHRILNQPVLPGATYVEMLGLIASNELNTEQFKINNLNLYTPFEVNENLEKSLYTIVKEEFGLHQFSIRQKYRSEKEGICAKGSLGRVSDEKVKTFDIDEIIHRCDALTINDAEKELNKDTSFLELGKRWTCLKTIHLGNEEGVAVIHMPEEFIDDFADYRYHPAMLDIAFNYFAAWKIGQSEYLPFSLKNLRVYKSVPRKMYSYVKQNGSLKELKETISFQVNLIDESGELILSIEEYILKKVYSKAVMNNVKIGVKNERDLQQSGDSKDVLLEEGIKSVEGAKIFDTIVSNFLLTGSSDYAQLIVSNNDLQAILKNGQDTDAYSFFRSNKSGDDQTYIDRPELSELFEAPVNDTQERLCEFFQNYLRIKKLGINDNFFELGISSLDVAEIKIGIETVFQIELPIAVIFEKSCIKALSIFIDQELAGEKEEEVVDRSEQVREGRRLLQKRFKLSE